MPQQTQWIDTRQLRIGLYIHLDLSWLEHPFAFSHFRISQEDQIRTIRALGLARVRYSPELSDEDVALAVASQPTEPPPSPEAAPPLPPTTSPVLLAKQAMREKVRQRRAAAERIEKAFVATAHTLRDIERTLYSQPEVALATANRLVQSITDTILTAPEMVIQVIGDKPGGEELYLHALNVATLSLIVGRELHLPRELMNRLGTGALLHDIGQHDIPDRILRRPDARTAAERHFFEQHPTYGVTMARKMDVEPAVLDIIGQHHEFHDGSGYPARLKGEEVHLLARIVVITNHFDGLCNPPDLADALTPHEALSLMFARLQPKFDPTLLKVFIHCMGVYPPGTLVQLSNGMVGMVTSVNTQRPMKPVVLVHDDTVPRDEAILLDLETEPRLNISKAMRPSQVPREILGYLNPRTRLSYYFDGEGSSRHGSPS